VSGEFSVIMPLGSRAPGRRRKSDDPRARRPAVSRGQRRIGATGLVGQYQLGLADSLFLTGSVRHDLNDLFNDTTTWRLTAAYKVEATGTKLRASTGTGVKNPTMFELYGFTNTYRGNPGLKPERAEGWDAGFDQQIWGERVVLDATYFEQRISDLIVGSGQSSTNLPGTATARGVELGLSMTPVDDLTIRASYTYTDAEDSTGRSWCGGRATWPASTSTTGSWRGRRTSISASTTIAGRRIWPSTRCSIPRR
jgi:vitamin B12 transporter